MPAERFLLMQSWWLASLLFRRHPELKLIETHPGGGQYDCLTLVRKPAGNILINRAGSIHVNDAPESPPMLTAGLLDLADSSDYVAALERAAGLGSPAHAPASTPATLTYRVIAQLMAITLNSKERWDVRNVVYDSSGGDGGVKDGYLTPFPIAVERARESRPDDVCGNPFYRYWGVLRAGKPVAVLDTDGFAYVGQQVLYLPDIYAAHSRRMTPTVAMALGAVLP